MQHFHETWKYVKVILKFGYDQINISYINVNSMSNPSKFSGHKKAKLNDLVLIINGEMSSRKYVVSLWPISMWFPSLVSTDKGCWITLNRFGAHKKHIKWSHFHHKWWNIFQNVGGIVIETYIKVIPKYRYDQIKSLYR